MDEVAALAGLSPAETLRRSEALAAAHLLERTGHDRYSMHGLTRLYAKTLATDDARALVAA